MAKEKSSSPPFSSEFKEEFPTTEDEWGEFLESYKEKQVPPDVWDAFEKFQTSRKVTSSPPQEEEGEEEIITYTIDDDAALKRLADERIGAGDSHMEAAKNISPFFPGCSVKAIHDAFKGLCE